MTVKFTNNASTSVATGINTSATSLTVASASAFPQLSGADDYCYLTIQGATNTNREVVKATALSSNTFTIVRAQDNTTAGTWSSGDIVELRLTAALLQDVIDQATVEGIKTNFQYIPTANQTQFSGADNSGDTMIINDAELINVYMNGVRLVQGSDYTVSSANNRVTLATGATTADVIDIEVFGNFTGQSGADVAITGGAIAGTAITTGSINNTPIGATQANTVAATTLTANSVAVDNITLDGNEIDVSSGDLTLDVAGNIILNADGAYWKFVDGSTELFQINSGSQNTNLRAMVADKDIRFQGYDGDLSTLVTALTLDMSEAGRAIFNADANMSDGYAFRFGDSQDLLIYHSSNQNIIQANTSDQDLLFKGNDGGSSITALTLDMSEGGKATFSGDIIANKNLRLRTTDDQAQEWYFYTYTDDTLRINYNGAGADALIFDTSENAQFSGNVGVGVSPATAMDVDGVLQLRGSGYATYATRIYTRLDSTHASVIESYLNNTTPFEMIGTYADSGGANPRIVLGAGGQSVGIGNDNPQEKLHVYTTGHSRVEAESTTGVAAFKATNNQGSYAWYVDNSADAFHLFDFTDNAQRITVDGSGNVGIGAVTPAHELIIHSDTNPTLGIVGAGYNDLISIRFGGGDLTNALGSTNSGAAILSQQAVSSGQAKGDLQFQVNTGDQLDTVLTLNNSGNMVVSGTASVAGDVNLGGTTDGSRRFKWYNDTFHSLYYDSDILGTQSAEVFTYYQNVVFRHQDSTNTVVIRGSTGNLELIGGGTIEAPSSSGGEGLQLKAAGSVDVIIDSNGNSGDGESFTVYKHSNTKLMEVSENGSVTLPSQPGFFARGNTSQWLQGYTNSWHILTSGISHGNGSTIGVNLAETDHGSLHPYDSGSDFAPSTGRFTVPVTGKYHVHGSMYCGKFSNTAGEYAHFLVYVNGQQINEIYTIGGHMHGFTHDFHLNFSTILRLDEDDYIEWKVYTTSTNIRIYGDHLSIGAHMIS